jgi:hypothetical protein
VYKRRKERKTNRSYGKEERIRIRWGNRKMEREIKTKSENKKVRKRTRKRGTRKMAKRKRK